MNRTVLLLVVALLLSLGLNAIQWIAAPPPARRADTSDATPGVVADGETEGPDEIGCWVELAECRADDLEESAMTARMFTDYDAAMAPETPGIAAPNSPTPPSPTGEVDAEFQEDVLSTIAESHLRREWEEQREDTIANLRRSLADDGERRAMLDRDVSRALQLFDVAEADRARVEAEYRRTWETRVMELREALDAEPADSSAAFEIAKTLFEDQDALIAEHFGADGRRRLRLAQAERRTVVLALLAVHAGAEWDDGITW